MRLRLEHPELTGRRWAWPIRTLWVIGALVALLSAGAVIFGASVWNSFFPNQAVKTQSTQLAIDAQGGHHVAYSELDEDGDFQASVFYGHCQTDCAVEASWTFVAVPHGAGAPDEVSIAVEGTRPRILVRGRKQEAAGSSLLSHPYHYLSCDANCAAAGNWSDSGTVAVSDHSDPFLDSRSQSYFALHDGRPRFLYRKAYTFQDPDPPPPTGLYLAWCDTNCEAAAGWSRQFVTPIDSNTAEYPSLAIDAAGRPHVVLEQSGADFYPNLFYLVCADATCSTPPTPRQIDGTRVPAGWRLRVDAQGRPRLAFFQSEHEGGGNQLRYAWCDGDCAGSGTWHGYAVAGVPQTSQDGLHPDLLIAGDARYISYHRGSPNSDGSTTFVAFLATCTSNCESTTGSSWSQQQADTVAAMEAEFPVPAPIGCPNNFWYSGYRSSLALAPDGSPRIGHDANRLAGRSTGEICHETWRAARISIFGEGTTPGSSPTGTPTSVATATPTNVASGTPANEATATPTASPTPTRTPSGTGTPVSPATQLVYLPFVARANGAGGSPPAATATPTTGPATSPTISASPSNSPTSSPSVTVDAPPEVSAGSGFDVTWTGPNNTGDFIALYAIGETNSSRYISFALTRNGTPARLRAPDLPLGQSGAYEVRYVSGQSRLTWATDRVNVTPVSATVDAPASVGPGATFQVSWTGPNNTGDFIALYPVGETNSSRYISFALTRNGTPARLRAPDLPAGQGGTYEVRYVSGQSRLTWATDTLTVE